MQHFYRKLFKEAIVPEVIRSTEEALKPIEDYLENAIKALNQKKVTARWKKVESLRRARIELFGTIMAIPKETIVQSEALRGHKEYDKVFGKGESYQLIRKISDTEAILDTQPRGKYLFDKEGEPQPYELIVSSCPKEGICLAEEDARYIVYDAKNRVLPGAEILKGDERMSYIHCNELISEGRRYSIKVDTKLFATIEEGQEALLEGNVYNDQELCFRLKEERQRGVLQGGYWIQLVEIDDKTQEEEGGLSPLRYFFDDDIIIKDDKGTSYSVLAGREDELQLRLGDGKKACYPPNNAILSVSVNTSQLKKQQLALRMLRKQPIEAHGQLIRLFLNLNTQKDDLWRECVPILVKSWEVLTDNARPGSIEQRRFVEKALSTPDFAFLAGPPGSGKTTVILELICQLIKQGKRVLLCGSTHVAIDNVLERIELGGLIERIGIMPIRVGDEHRISERVQHFQLDKVLDGNPEALHRLIRQSANLVCGTTIGILRHPDFSLNSNSAIQPQFDCLIIDESSKTTFQEFLVPALYAKKWVLVGDVMQLSPYTERELVESNLRQLKVREQSFSVEHQEAIYLLHRLDKLWIGSKRGQREELKGNFVLPIKKECLDFIRKELSEGRVIKKPFQICLVGENLKEQNLCSNQVHCCNVKDCTALSLSAYDIIFVEQQLMKRMRIPETHAVLWTKTPEWWSTSSFLYKHQALSDCLKSSFIIKGGAYHRDDERSVSEKAQTLVYDKSWAEEVAWRIDREHQLRLLTENKIKSYKEQVEELIPTDSNKGLWIAAINRIATIAYPSILESLERGISHKKDLPPSTFTQGFDVQRLKERREILTYQHRMHPEISRFSRERFYSRGEDQALLDNEKLDRDWTYSRYPRRCLWIDVVNGQSRRGANEKEAKCMMEELKAFVEYAKHNPKQERWTVACLTFYRGQERRLRDMLQDLSKSKSNTHFSIDGVAVVLCTVDRFQGQEADVVFLSMVQTNRVGFMDSPNRLNVALTRARYQTVIIGAKSYFANQGVSEDLASLVTYADIGLIERRRVTYNNNYKVRNNRD